jgi:hypothetical protein
MNEHSPKDAKLLLTSDGHELIVGRTTSGKTTKAIKRVNDDVTSRRKAWVVSLYNRELAKFPGVDWSAGSIDDAIVMLRKLVAIVDEGSYEGPHLVVTIDDATKLLNEESGWQEITWLVDCCPAWLRLRLVIGSTLHEGVGGSTFLYNELIEDAKEID